MSRQTGRYSGKPTGGDPGFPPGTRNGRIPLNLMRKLETQPHLKGSSRYLWPEAARGLDAMAQAAKRDGIALRLVAGYRSYAGQVAAKKRWEALGKPGYAATPGTSNHGWGSAIDVDRHSRDTLGIVEWLKVHAVEFGWDHPRWAGDGVGVEEPWHWQFIAGWEMAEELKRIKVRVNGHDQTDRIPSYLAETPEGMKALGTYTALWDYFGWEPAPEFRDGTLYLVTPAGGAT